MSEIKFQSSALAESANVMRMLQGELEAYAVKIAQRERRDVVSQEDVRRAMEELFQKRSRPQVEPMWVDMAQQKIRQKLEVRLEKKGHGSFSSKHEILGMMSEEYLELVLAVHSKEPGKLEEELLDLGVGAQFGLACYYKGSLQW